MRTTTQAFVTIAVSASLAACGAQGGAADAQDDPNVLTPAQEDEAIRQDAPADIVSEETVMDPHGEGRHDQHHPLPALPGGASLEGDFLGTDGQGNGTVMIAETPNGLLMRVDVTGIEHGFHGVHLHETGLCEPDEGFSTAGGHANPDGVPHGVLTEGGPHLGDLPNAYVHEEGHLRTDLFKDGATLADLQDADGFAVMVHSGPDDYQSQPSGDAGSRVACAAFPAE